MSLINRLLLAFTLLCMSMSFVQAQDSTRALDGWTVKSNRIAEGKYELQFHLPSVQGWQLYAPSQPVPDLATTELHLEDSSVQVQLPFINEATPNTIQSPLFGSQVAVYTKEAGWKVTIAFKNTVPQKLRGIMSYSYGRNDEFYTARLPFSVELEGGVASAIRIHIPSIDINNPVADCGDTVSKNGSSFTIFILGFLGGLIALFTPCVFPMIPLTVSFFTKKEGSKSKGVGSAMLYGFFIFLIYILITVPFHIADNTGADIFNNISTNVWLNLLFFVIFVAFALSFFGLYELSLPSGIANKADSRSGLGNLAGIFFMALTLAIVSFSCTGPILGTLLANVADGGAWPLTIGAAGFGLALGLPFALFALFPRWLQAIPKSGGWMTDLKVVLGFVELALAVKFLANADNVQQWGILKREVFFAAWIIIGICIVAYLMGWLRIGHSTRPKKIRGLRLLFVIIFSATTLYLIPGVTNTHWAKLSLISGFPPPTCYSLYSNPVNCEKPLLDYEEALVVAKATNKPILIDFTGWACVNCRRMEENVWTNPAVERLMKEEFVLVSLYVDERTKLPAHQRTVHTMKNGSEKSIITVGDRWTAFQLENFDATAQPQYAIVSPDEKALTKTKFYTAQPKEFAAWLECGLKAHKERKGE